MLRGEKTYVARSIFRTAPISSPVDLVTSAKTRCDFSKRANASLIETLGRRVNGAGRMSSSIVPCVPCEFAMIVRSNSPRTIRAQSNTSGDNSSKSPGSASWIPRCLLGKRGPMGKNCRTLGQHDRVTLTDRGIGLSHECSERGGWRPVSRGRYPRR